ncbi:MAG: 3-isopropylmalate dehydratase small subunit [Clostridiales Family XIII bacterium]|jgi:3-isopropylmalate/(R)-2-methylmalate dehydratase small subunit|nr:3-isopropylmalate dehydratase small subunit [Clostridiales Family XIII bacterium]
MTKVYKYGDNIDTDVIIPARYLNKSDDAHLASHAMEDIDKNFAKTVKTGDIIVAGENFGCGSSREHAPIALKKAGIKTRIAKSFASIFYRNSFNIGLPIVESYEASEKIDTGDEIKIDFQKGIIKNLTKNEKYKITKIPEFMQSLIASGGLVEFSKKI